MTHITFKKITLFLITTYVLLFIPRMVLADTCPSVAGVITTAGIDGCTSQPTTQRVRVLKASLCTSSPSAATTLAAIGKAAAGCQVIFTSDDATGDSVDIINGATVNLTGSAIIPPIGTYSHLVVEINPTMATVASKSVAVSKNTFILGFPGKLVGKTSCITAATLPPLTNEFMKVDVKPAAPVAARLAPHLTVEISWAKLLALQWFIFTV